jgi:hypothetical protein
MPVIHKIAVYFDDAGRRQEIKAKLLQDPNELERAKLLELYDGSEQIRVAPRAPSGITPHFYEINNSGSRKVYGGEDNDLHDGRVKQLTKDLTGFSCPFSLVLKASARDNEVIQTLIKMPEYQWGYEVHRILNADIMVRHDIFGQSAELGMSVQRPWIAIEVIYTHYPDEKAFSALLEQSKAVPLIVLFDLASNKNTFLKVDTENKQLQIRPWTYYIKEGAVWRGERKVPHITTSTRLQIEIEALLKRWKR